jgi:hypothetical protein
MLCLRSLIFAAFVGVIREVLVKALELYVNWNAIFSIIRGFHEV